MTRGEKSPRVVVGTVLKFSFGYAILKWMKGGINGHARIADTGLGALERTEQTTGSILYAPALGSTVQYPEARKSSAQAGHTLAQISQHRPGLRRSIAGF